LNLIFEKLHNHFVKIGFFHEQSRPDRDQYVQIQWSNVIAGK